MIRKPVAAGQFYPGDASELRETIGRLVDEKVQKQEAIGAVSPHAGYIYSGSVAGAVFSRIKLPETAIILGPNHTGRGKLFSIMGQGAWQTPLGEVPIDRELAGKLKANSRHLEEDATAHLYEHSIEVQLPFLQYFQPKIRLVPIVLAPAEGPVYKEIGQAIAKTIRESKKGVVIIASSDMTHYESQQSAQSKDSQATEAILQLDEEELLKRVEELHISMCGYAPAVSLISAAKALGAREAELVKYQTSGDATGDYQNVVGYAGIIIKKARALPPLAELAKQSVESYVREGKISAPKELTPEMKEKAGVFVCLKKFGELRGCIGTFEPCTRNIAEEVMANAVGSAMHDPRFRPVSPGELPYLSYSVDVLTKPEPVAGPEQLDPKRYGVIVEAGYRRGLLLPDLEGVDTVEQQLDICRQKAGIKPEEPVKLYRFEVKRYE